MDDDKFGQWLPTRETNLDDLATIRRTREILVAVRAALSVERDQIMDQLEIMKSRGKR